MLPRHHSDGRWNMGAVKNAITDYEEHEWPEALSQAGAAALNRSLHNTAATQRDVLWDELSRIAYASHTLPASELRDMAMSALGSYRMKAEARAKELGGK